MASVQELQAEINSSEAVLAALTSERAAATKAMQTIGADAERVRDVDRRMFEARQTIMQQKIELLDLEKAPLLERLRTAQTATTQARAAYTEAFKALQVAEQLEHDAGVPLSTNSFARVALAEEMEQQTLERTLAMRAQTTGKPVLATMGAYGRPARNQPEFEAPRR